MKIKDTLNEIDVQLEAMSKNNRLIIYAFLVISFVGFGYYILGAFLMDEAVLKEAKISQLKRDILKIKLPVYKKQIEAEKKVNYELSQVYEREKYKSTSLKVKIDDFEHLSADERGLADALDKILKKSVQLRVNIDKVSIDEIHDKVSTQIDKRWSISINGKASFYSIQRLLSFIESQDILLKVEYIKLNLNEEKHSIYPDFKIILAGYEVVI